MVTQLENIASFIGIDQLVKYYTQISQQTKINY